MALAYARSRHLAIFKEIKADTERLVDDIKIAEQRFVKDDGLDIPDEIRLTAEQKRNTINAQSLYQKFRRN